MSFDTDPANYDYAVFPNECPICYAAAETPATLFAAINGIDFGTAVPGVDDPPLNGLHELTATGLCSWNLVVGAWTLTYLQLLPGSLFQIWKPGPVFQFLESLIAPCITAFDNSKINPAVDPYYGGNVTMINPKDTQGNSTLEVMELLNMSPTGDPWANPRPIDVDTTAHAIYNPDDATRIHIARTNP